VTPGTYAQFKTTEGNFAIRLFEQEAPRTVENFVALAEGTKEWTDPRTNQKVKTPYYNGIVFHRVIERFMIQGGDPLGQGIGGPGYNFADELPKDVSAYKPGSVAMANSGPNTNGSQFFITQVPTPWLDGRHTIFGQVTQGMDVVNKIVAAPRDGRDKPLETISMKTVKILK